MASNTTRKKTGSASSAKEKSTGSKSAAAKAANSRPNSKAGSSRGKTSSAAVRAKSAESQPAAAEQTNPQIMQEAVLWLILAACVLIFISYFGICGYVGEVISDICFGVFGVAAYIFPLLLFVASAFLISNRGSRIAGMKFASCVGLYLCVCSFAALFSEEYDTVSNFRELYEMSAARKSGGGVVGGFLCNLLRPALGSIGTGIILFILMLVFLLLVTQKSLMRSVKRQSSRIYRSAKESGARRREAHRQEAARRTEWELSGQNEIFADAETKQDAETRQARNPKEQETRTRRAPGPVGQDADTRRAQDQENQAPLQEAHLKHYQTEPVQAKYTQSGRTQQPGTRTQIDVPVLFPVNSRENRSQHRVTGVTMDTKLEGSPERVGAQIHEIIPKNRPVQESAEKPSSGRRGRAARTADTNISGASSANAAEPQTSYIDLEQLAPDKKDTPASAIEVYQEGMKLHIEGLGKPEEAEDGSATEQKAEPFDLGGEGAADDGFSEMNAMDDNSYGEAAGVRKTSSASSDGVGQDDTDAQESAKAGKSAAPSPKKNPRSSQKEIAEGIASVEAEMAKAAETVRPEYVYPPLSLLKKGKGSSGSGQEQEIRKTAAKLQQTLDSFGVHATVTNVSRGPSVTRYELRPEQGVKVNRIVSLTDDIKLNLAAADIRIEAPIPGKAAVGIEVPNQENSAVMLRDLLESDEFQKHPSKLAFATGKDISGKVVVSDIEKMPHLLIAGATGSGKSVCINTLIMSILYKAHPDEVKLIMIDPKVVELSAYNGIPHLFIPVVTDPKKAAGALNWGVAEMTDRYNKFAEYGVRNLKGYNKKVEELKDIEDENKPKKLPQIVIIVDELADLMMVAPGEVEDAICRLAQLARAAGIHLIIATQRPSVNVITGLIKANMPSRIAFSVTSNVDSRTIIDMAGAEKLLGKGDMLFYPQGYQKPARVQGAFVSDEEVADVVDFLKNKNTDVSYSAEIEEQIAKVQSAVSATRGDEDNDALFADAGKFIIEKDKASIGMLQRVFKIGFNRAARIMDQLSDAGVVGPEEGTKPRKILMSAEEFENYLEQN